MTTRQRASRLSAFPIAAQVETLEQRAVMTTIDLGNLGAGGTTILGADADDISGSTVSNAGDVNGDGFDDMIIGACYGDGPGNGRPTSGESYLIFGGPTLPNTIDLGNLGAAGVTIYGAETNDYSGFAVSGAGDVNGDGFDDLIVGSPHAAGLANGKPYSGETYLIYGKASLPATIDLGTLGSNGVTLYGEEDVDFSGFRVSRAGDLNGDGFDDVILESNGGDAANNQKLNAGDNYVLFGAASLPSTIALSSLGTKGITIHGADSEDRSGNSVSSAGDVNGDGFDDLLIGSNAADGPGNTKGYAGEVYVLFGGSTLPTTVDLGSPGSVGVTIFGADINDQLGRSVKGAGDLNGDGFDDLVLGAHEADAAGNAKNGAGETYVIFGSASLPAVINLATAGSAGLIIYGADAGDQSGIAVSGGGDVNGDGYDDLIIGAQSADAANNAKANAGESYVIFGGPALPATIDLANLGSNGMTIYGADGGDTSGFAVSMAGDVNGDGFDDLLIGAYRGAGLNNLEALAGETYVLFGGDFTSAVTQPGTANSESLTGNSSDNVLIGGRGNDTLQGNGGADVEYGGQGDDILEVASTSFRRVDGGNGDDTLRLTGSGLNLDLTTISNSRVANIETIDIRGTGANTLTLNFREVLNLTANSNPSHTVHKLVVRRGADDASIAGRMSRSTTRRQVGPPVPGGRGRFRMLPLMPRSEARPVPG